MLHDQTYLVDAHNMLWGANTFEGLFVIELDILGVRRDCRCLGHAPTFSSDHDRQQNRINPVILNVASTICSESLSSDKFLFFFKLTDSGEKGSRMLTSNICRLCQNGVKMSSEQGVPGSAINSWKCSL